jgi:hypothetical protein
MHDLDFSVEREFVARTLADAVRQFDQAMGPSLGRVWPRPQAGQSKMLLVKVNVPAAARDSALPAVERLGKQLAAKGGRVQLGRNAEDGLFHLNVSEVERPVEQRPDTHAPGGSVLPTWLQRWAAKWFNMPVADTGPDPELVRRKLQEGYAKAKRLQLDNKKDLVGCTVNYLYASWKPALQRHADANRAKGWIMTLNHLDGLNSVPHDLMAEIMEDKVWLELHYRDVPQAARSMSEEPSTLPPDWEDDEPPAQTKPRTALVTMRFGSQVVEEAVPLDGKGELTLARCGTQAAEMTRLLRDLDAERRLSSKLERALRLRLADTGAVVTAAGDPAYYRLQDNRPITLSAKLPFPVGVLANGVHIEVRLTSTQG